MSVIDPISLESSDVDETTPEEYYNYTPSDVHMPNDIQDFTNFNTTNDMLDQKQSLQDFFHDIAFNQKSKTPNIPKKKTPSIPKYKTPNVKNKTNSALNPFFIPDNSVRSTIRIEFPSTHHPVQDSVFDTKTCNDCENTQDGAPFSQVKHPPEITPFSQVEHPPENTRPSQVEHPLEKTPSSQVDHPPEKTRPSHPENTRPSHPENTRPSQVSKLHTVDHPPETTRSSQVDHPPETTRSSQVDHPPETTRSSQVGDTPWTNRSNQVARTLSNQNDIQTNILSVSCELGKIQSKQTLHTNTLERIDNNVNVLYNTIQSNHTLLETKQSDRTETQPNYNINETLQANRSLLEAIHSQQINSLDRIDRAEPPTYHIMNETLQANRSLLETIQSTQLNLLDKAEPLPNHNLNETLQVNRALLETIHSTQLKTIKSKPYKKNLPTSMCSIILPCVLFMFQWGVFTYVTVNQDSTPTVSPFF
jgi:hypothetical protein